MANRHLNDESVYFFHVSDTVREATRGTVGTLSRVDMADSSLNSSSNNIHNNNNINNISSNNSSSNNSPLPVRALNS